MNKKDLTRWNRSGLKAFRYIDGNAITYLETLRLALNEEYNANSPPQWQELVSRFPQLANESPLQKNKRITDQYYDERRDFAWEILRSFARSVHVLGEYINAYANEAYLPTAIEWDNVRKLVALLGYQPSPPSSAMTSIALLLKPGQSGEINRGFAIKNKPAKGAATIIFETQEKMKGHALINTMRLKDWNRNPQTIKTQKQGRFRNIVFELPQLAKDINIGDQGVLVAAKKGYPIEVISIKHKKHNSRITLRARSKMPKKIALADTTLYLQPQFIEKPLPNGKGSASLSAAVNLADGEVVISGKSSSLAALKVVQAKQKLVLFEPSTFNEDDSITRALISKKQHLDDFPKIDSPANDFFILNDVANKDKVFVVDEKLNPVSKKIEKEDSTNTFYIEGKNLGDTLYYTQKPLTSKPLATVINVGNATVTSLQFSGKASELTSGQWLWVKHKNGKRAAYQISKIKQQQDQFHLTLPSTKAVALIQSNFKQTLKHRDFDINNNPAWSPRSNNASTVFELEDKSLLSLLKLGQKLICSSQEKSIAVEIKKIENQLIYVSPPFHLDYKTAKKARVFTRNNTRIYGNVVNASHGETQAQIILGSGDASQTGQHFKLQSDQISWLNDPSFNTGVRADVLVTVENRYWQQVENLSLSAAEDHHYQIKIDEDNKLSIHFGDGRHGRKLPTGIDNIRVTFREGNGETGNLAPHSLVKIARPDPLVDDFIAPLAATGGAEKESPAHMRENAPAALLSLNRAVSLRDFEHLARHHSMVWQAKAFERVANRPAPTAIEVVVVAAGGSPFAANSELAQTLKTFFVQHAIPSLPISVASYQPLLMQIQPSIMVDVSAFDKKVVTLAVKQHLQTMLSLKQRQLGQALFRSAVIALIEEVQGVENANCEIIGAYLPAKTPADVQVFKGNDGEIRKISIQPQQLLYLDTDIYALNIISKNFEL